MKRQFWGGGRPIVKYRDCLPWAVQKQLNQRRCSLGCWVSWVHEPCIRWGAHWCNLVNMTAPSVCAGHAALYQLSNYFNHLFSDIQHKNCNFFIPAHNTTHWGWSCLILPWCLGMKKNYTRWGHQAVRKLHIWYKTYNVFQKSWWVASINYCMTP